MSHEKNEKKQNKELEKSVAASIKEDYKELVEKKGYKIIGVTVNYDPFENKFDHEKNTIQLIITDDKILRMSNGKDFRELSDLLPSQYFSDGKNGQMKAYKVMPIFAEVVDKDYMMDLHYVNYRLMKE